MICSHHARCLQDVNKCCRWVCLPQKSLQTGLAVTPPLGGGFWKEKGDGLSLLSSYHLLLSEAPPLHFTLPCLVPLCFTPGLKRTEEAAHARNSWSPPSPSSAGNKWEAMANAGLNLVSLLEQKKYTPLVRSSDLANVFSIKRSITFCHLMSKDHISLMILPQGNADSSAIGYSIFPSYQTSH